MHKGISLVGGLIPLRSPLALASRLLSGSSPQPSGKTSRSKRTTCRLWRWQLHLTSWKLGRRPKSEAEIFLVFEVCFDLGSKRAGCCVALRGWSIRQRVSMHMLQILKPFCCHLLEVFSRMGPAVSATCSNATYMARKCHLQFHVHSDPGHRPNRWGFCT